MSSAPTPGAGNPSDPITATGSFSAGAPAAGGRRAPWEAVLQRRVTHAYLFAGPPGAGQHQVALQAATAMLCTNPVGGRPCGDCAGCQQVADGVHPDLIIPEQYGIEAARRIVSALAYRPQAAQRKVVLWHDVHRLTPQAANALLKSVEEPPSFAVFLFTTDHLEGVLPTLRSRCQTVVLRARPRHQTAQDLAAAAGVAPLTAYWALLACQDNPQEAATLVKDPETAAEANRLRGMAEQLMKGDILDALEVARQLSQWEDRVEAAAELIVLLLRGENPDRWAGQGLHRDDGGQAPLPGEAPTSARLAWTRALADFRRALGAHANRQVATEVFCWRCWQGARCRDGLQVPQEVLRR